MIQMRLDASDKRFYNPSRDLAYCSRHLLIKAVRGLDPDKQEPWVMEYLRRHGITEDQLNTAVKAIAEYTNCGCGVVNPKFKQPFEVLAESGFLDLPVEVQTVVLAKIGQVFLSAVFTCIRDVTRDPREPILESVELAEAAAKTLTSISRYQTWWGYFTYKLRRLFSRTKYEAAKAPA